MVNGDLGGKAQTNTGSPLLQACLLFCYGSLLVFLIHPGLQVIEGIPQHLCIPDEQFGDGHIVFIYLQDCRLALLDKQRQPMLTWQMCMTRCER